MMKFRIATLLLPLALAFSVNAQTSTIPLAVHSEGAGSRAILKTQNSNVIQTAPVQQVNKEMDIRSMSQQAVKFRTQPQPVGSTSSRILPVRTTANSAGSLKSQSSVPLKATAATPSALYNRPAGTYPLSWIGAIDPANMGYSYLYQAYAGSAFTMPWTFRNLSTNATSYVWNWGNSSVYSTAQNASFSIPTLDYLVKGDYYMPMLKAVNGVDTSYYNLPDLQWTDGTYASRMSASTEVQSMGLADFYGNTATLNTQNMSLYLYKDGVSLDGVTDGYLWGTCLRELDEVDGFVYNSRTGEIAVEYEKPMSPLVIKDLTFFGYSFASKPIPAGKQLDVTLIKLTDIGKFSDTIAVTSITADDIIYEQGYLYMPAYFYKTDPSTGRVSPANVVVNDRFVVVLSGLDQDGMDFGLFSDSGNQLDNSTFFGKVDELTGDFLGYYGFADGNGMNAYLTLDAYFDFMVPDPASENLYIYKTGGSAYDKNNELGALVYTFHSDLTDSITGDPLIWLDDTTLPDWLTISYDKSFYSAIGGLVFDFQATALPAGMVERSADVVLETDACSVTLHVKQSLTAGIENTNATDVQISKDGDYLNLQNLEGFTGFKMYNSSGQLILVSSLSGNTNKSIPVSGISKGAYLIQLTGAHTVNRKIVL